MAQLGLLSLPVSDTQSLIPISVINPLMPTVKTSILPMTPIITPLIPISKALPPVTSENVLVPQVCTDCAAPATTPGATTPDFLSSATTWIKDNTLLAFLLGAGAVYLLTRKSKNNGK